jgi:hypothetical protein
MVWLKILRKDDESVVMVAERLKQANVDEITGLKFVDVCFDQDIVVCAVIDFFHRAFQKGCILGCLAIYDCTGRVDAILNAAALPWTCFTRYRSQICLPSCHTTDFGPLVRQ